MTGPTFAGFQPALLAFLNGLRANNTRDWFQANRATYEAVYRKPAQAFADAAADALHGLTGDTWQAKIFRIHRDLRFAKDKTPYNTHLHIGFAAEGAAAGASGWFFGLSPDQLSVGCGCFDFGPRLAVYRVALAGDSGAALDRHLGRIAAGGGRLHGVPELKRVPRGFDAEHPRAELLRRKSLSVWSDFPTVHDCTSSSLLADCTQRWQSLRPVHDWLQGLG